MGWGRGRAGVGAGLAVGVCSNISKVLMPFATTSLMSMNNFDVYDCT